MKIIISPAKRFKHFENEKTEGLLFEEETKELVEKLRKYSINDLANMFFCNDDLAIKAYYDYKDFDFNNLKNPALFSYDGLVFKQFKKEDFNDLSYLNDHVYIISALYGLCKPFTGISDYRLYMDSKGIDMPGFWADKIYEKAFEDEDFIINLASAEYAKLLKKYLKKDQKLLTLTFKEDRNGKIRSIVSYTKQMRGRMLKYLINKKIKDPEEIKKIILCDYIYDPYNSTDNEFIYVREEK
ncbi:MAG: YaaA family protein [Anaerococcus hydrogenalis]|uniref:YaaA family protein n=1 Tax=Anaerococcus hydrogenalis TaxID=33029 RepID=UPI002903A235|nr:YaaA family protein [Anaerococcus hydrogenalis]MDU2582950.1 YaaA family protein [Anaerococcus hydrogenalis]